MSTHEELLPAHDETAEQAVLGAILLSGRVLDEVAETLTAQAFYAPKHSAVFTAALAVRDAGQPVDAVTVLAELERRGWLEKVGGGPYLHTLLAVVPTAANAGFYADRVAECARLRGLAETGTRIVQSVHQAGSTEAAELIERARAALDHLAQAGRTGGAAVELDELLHDGLAELAQPAAPALSTGFPDLDAVLGGGLKPGGLYVVGARPGLGKSILCLQCALNAARGGTGAFVVSLEMSRSDVMVRIFASEASVELGDLTRRNLTSSDWQRLRDAAGRARAWPLAVDDTAELTLTAIRSRARDRARRPGGLGLLVVDYLQLVKPADPRAPREQQVAAISRGLKLLGRELDVPVLAAAQINRASEQRTDRRPSVADLRESGAIEADADAVLLLHDDPDQLGELEVVIGKNRHGPRRSVHLAWSPHYARARSMAA